jgi:hypothetical protein
LALELQVVSPGSFGVGAVLSTQQAVQQQAFTPSLQNSIVASVASGNDSAFASLAGLSSATLTFTSGMSLTNLLASGSTAQTATAMMDAIDLTIVATAGETGPVILEIRNALSYTSGIASAFCQVANQVSSVYTGGDPDVLAPSPYPKSEVITLSFNVLDTFRFGVFVYGDPTSGPVLVNFTSTLFISQEIPVPLRNRGAGRQVR